MTGLLTFLQAACLAGAYLLDDLSRKKAGVNHHVVYRKNQYMKTILDADHRFVYGILAILILAGLVIYLLRHREGNYVKILIPLVLWTMAAGAVLFLPAVMERPTYVYLLGIVLVVWLLQCLKSFLRLKQMNGGKSLNQ